MTSASTSTKKKSWTTISGYYIHDRRKAAKYAFEEFLICVTQAPHDSCTDIEKGLGKIELNAENLVSGIYTYSIEINGKVIDTKKMMKNH